MINYKFNILINNFFRYGLIVRGKQNTELSFQASRNVFGSDNESDDDTGKRPVLLQSNANSNRQVLLVKYTNINIIYNLYSITVFLYFL